MVFIYKVTNILDGKFYVGVHRGDPDDGYLGSGLHIKRAVKRDGAHNFKRQVLMVCENDEETYDIEHVLVDETFTKRRDTYNLKVGGKGGWDAAVKFGQDNVMRRPDVARRVSDAVRSSMTDEERQARSERMSCLRADGTVRRAAGGSTLKQRSASCRSRAPRRWHGTQGWSWVLNLSALETRRRRAPRSVQLNRTLVPWGVARSTT